MHFVACVKRVPDTETRIRIAADGKTIDPQGVNYVINPYDEYAVEECLRLKEAHGGTVTVVAVGPAEAQQTLRTALATGADKALLIEAPKADELDNLAVARALAAKLRELAFDALFFGRLAIDDQAGAVGPMVATLLELPCVTDVVKFELAEGKALAHRAAEGRVEVYEVPLPAVFTAQKWLNEPRYAKLKDIMAAKKKPLDVAPIGEAAASLSRERIELPPPRAAGKILKDPATAVPELVRLLHEEAKLI